jgi:hypothetical protein
MKQYVHTDLEADRQVATILAELIIGGSLASVNVSNSEGGWNTNAVRTAKPTGTPARPPDQDPVSKSVSSQQAEGPFHDRKGPLAW